MQLVSGEFRRGADRIIAVPAGKLETTTLDWRLVLNNPAIPRADFIRSILRSRLGEDALAQLEKHGPPVSTWPRYAQRYRWQIIVEGMHEPLSMLIRHFNPLTRSGVRIGSLS